MNKTSPHIPVLLNHVLNCFDMMNQEGIFIDCTLGYGGHSEEILKKFENIKLIGMDQDIEAIEFSFERLKKYGDRFETRKGRFSDILPALLSLPVSGILADFGVSSLQLDKKERGFSFESKNLDMRMDPESSLSAYEVVNRYPKLELERIFKDYAEERAYRRVAQAIVNARSKKPIESGEELAHIMAPVASKHGKHHPATALFQAIRIEVNDELGEIERLLDILEQNPPSGAIVGLITFHSLEDRLVKQRFRKWTRNCICPSEAFRCTCGNNHALGKMINKKPLIADKEEIRQNARSRSAKLRCFKFGSSNERS